MSQFFTRMTFRERLVNIKWRIDQRLIRMMRYLIQHDYWIAQPFNSWMIRRVPPWPRRTKLVAMQWLDEGNEWLCRELSPALQSSSRGPAIDGKGQSVPVVLPPVRSFRFRDARISSLSSSVLLNDRVLVERCHGIDTLRCDYSADQLLMHGEESAFVNDRPEDRIERGLTLGGNGSSNYYHWLIELLSKLEFVTESTDEFATYPLLVGDAVAKTKTMHDALKLVAPDREVIVLEQHKTYRVADLLYINAPSTCPFNLRPHQSAQAADFLIRPSSIKFLRERLLIGGRSRASTERRRIFFARRHGRRNYNQDEIFALFEPLGFVKVFMEELSLTEQMDAASQAEFIAGPTGAAWTNLIFCQAGTRALCWMAEETGQFAAFSNLAHIVGVELQYVTYRTGARSTEELYTLDYAVDAGRVREVLRSLVTPTER